MSDEVEEFERLIGDQLITLGRSFDELYAEGPVRLSVDGQELEMNRIVPAYDAMDRTVPARRATIYDAIRMRYPDLEDKLGRAATKSEQGLAAAPAVHVLCHREHMRPAAVCRVCMVELAGVARLVPACQHPLLDKPKLVVSTFRTSERVRKAVSMVTELLLADHQSAKETWRESGGDELRLLQSRLGLAGSRFESSHIDRGRDDSSPVISVDHNSCILCDRCVRACNEVKENGVLARMNKGYQSRIAFDLNDPMGESSCVACGECMISCPTGALSNRVTVNVELGKEPRREPAEPSFRPVGPADLRGHALFKDISLPFLMWNKNAIVRRKYKKGDIVCRQGDFGATAFIIENGAFDVEIGPGNGRAVSKRSGLLGWLRGSERAGETDKSDSQEAPRTDLRARLTREAGTWKTRLTRADVIFGEMTCMNQYPRTATVVAASDDCEVLEILRNVLYMLGRTHASKQVLDQLYRKRSLETHLRRFSLFAKLPDTVLLPVIEFLKQRVKLIRVHPGQVIIREGERADHFYMVRIGFVKVSRRAPGGEQVANYIGPEEFFGEIGLLAQVPAIRDELNISEFRTATCASLDHVDLVRIDGQDFRLLLRAFLRDQSVLADVPEASKAEFQKLLDAIAGCDSSSNIANRIVQIARDRLQQNSTAVVDLESAPLEDFLRQGLMEASNLLVLDLEKCTRCDECVKACADIHHDGVTGNHVTRLIRDGLRFDKYLVASSCRSCMDPYCMVGCPVGSIQRNRNGTILIEDWCIGCGLCERNCPYGNITMHARTDGAATERIAITCDYCSKAGEVARCVYACPHDAAHRMTGSKLLQIVGSDTTHTDRR